MADEDRQTFEVLNPGGHANLIAGLKQYARRANSVNTSQIADAAVTDDKLDPDGVRSKVTQLESDLANVSIDVDDLGLDYDEDEKMLYVTYRDERSSNAIPATFGGGGGGGPTVNAKLTVENTTGWISTSITQGAECVLSLTWSSIEDGIATGDGTLTVTVDNVVKVVRTIEQGSVTVDVSPFLTVGNRKVKLRVTDVYDQSNVKTFTINVADLYVRSAFDTSGTFPAGQSFEYTYTPVGAVEKHMVFEVDGNSVGTTTVTTSGRQQTQVIPGLTHGAHILRVWFTATINGAEVTSNVLTHALVVVDASSNLPIISSPFSATTAVQYETLQIPYTVYTPNSLTSPVVLSVNGQQVSSLTVDRTEHTWSYRVNSIGALTLTIASGTITKTFSLTATASDIDVYAETANLSLYLTANGRSNNEAHPEVWEDADNHISATLTDFNFVSDGWITDSDGFTALRVANEARVTIPYKPFENDFRSTGKTLEFEFATRDIYDYDAVVISCWSGDRGFKLTAQQALLASEQSSVAMSYKEDEHVRVSFVAEKRTEDRLLLLYVNGIMSQVIQYPDNDDFSQQVPVNISIGNSSCATDIYCIRIYDNNLTRYQVLNNWIADTQDVTLMLQRYAHNNVYDEYGNITIENLPGDLPYMVIEAPELPQYKGDKKTVSGYYVDPVNASKSFSFTGCQINVQGTSSAVYDIKNFDLQFKNGFEMTQSGEHADNYALTANVVPFNRFVIKADVASSEGANNVELVKLFCDTDPYKRPEEIANPKVRKGIYGQPMVLFWHNTSTNETAYYSKGNFNLPKRAPGPYGYTGDMESWEFQNNTSNLMLFLTDYFDETMIPDPDTGDLKESWRYDYEARFPEDTWTDYSKLQELQSFVYSTYRQEATDNALAESVTYDGVTYTTDSAAYRLAKFKAEFGNYAEVSSFIFYYIFTELFLMVDSRAKNLFIGFSGGDATSLQHIDRKAVAEPYDMDSSLGINNEGALVFGYSLEDTDHLTGGADVFNGQNSVLWCNVRDAFGPEIAQMYKTLRSNGTLSYATVEQRFEDHQAKWPEAVFNEDAWAKYIGPLISPAAGKTATASYLSMAQGSKKEQRKWWLYNRFRYMDSKWTAGDARNSIIELRGYAKANITVTPYSDIYPAVRYASYTVTERGTHGVPTTLVCPIDTLNDSEIWIFSAPQLASVGDLSGLKVGRADFRAAVNLQDIRVGSNATGYTNPNLTELYVGNNSLLRLIDARNCTALTGALDFSGASNVEHVYLDGTNVTSVSLPVGGILKTLSLPDTITNLTVRSQPGITSFSMEGNDYSSITTLRVENSGTSIPVLSILDQMPENSRVRIIGFTAVAQDEQDVEDFFDYLDTMRGLDEAGNNLPNPVVSGTITGLGTITGAWLAEMNSRYPDVTIQYQHINSTLSYYSYDGSTLITTEQVTDGGNGTYSGTPSRTSTAQYSYAFAGWSLYQDQYVADPNATKSVGADRSVYAAYTRTTRTYTITWRNANGTTLETDENVAYGTMPTYNGATPTQDGEESTGWQPSVAAVTGNQTYTAVYVPVYRVRFYNGSTLLDTQNVREGGTAVYGGTTPVSSEGTYMEFTGWDKALTNITANTDVFAQFRDTRSDVIKYVEGTLMDYFSDTATTVADNMFRNRRNPVTATTSATTIGTYAFGANTALTTVDLISTNAVTISANAFKNCTNLDALIIRSATMSTLSAASAFISTAIANKQGAVYVPASLVSTYEANSNWSRYVIASIDDYPLTDFSDLRNVSWAQLEADVADGTAPIKYSVGQTKQVDLGTEGKVEMQIVGFGTDELSDSAGMAGISFVSKGILATTHRMNPANDSGTQGTGANGGWEYSEMRTYLSDTILPKFPSELQSAIKEVTKYSDNIVPGETSITHDQQTTDKLWIPSAREVFGGTSYEQTGPIYSDLFNSNSSRTKYDQNGAAAWFLRSAYTASTFRTTNSGGSVGSTSAGNTNGVALGFSIGTYKSPWESILKSIDDGDYATKYSIGDAVKLDLGDSLGVVNMQIAAFDADPIPGGGTSHITFLAEKTLVGTPFNMDSDGTRGSWANSNYRTGMMNTILPSIPQNVRDSIVEVTKYSDVYDKDAGKIIHDQPTVDKVWIPSAREVGITEYEQSGPIYSALFTDLASRIRKNPYNNTVIWQLRTAYSSSEFMTITTNGYTSPTALGSYTYFIFGFCL